MNPIKPLAILLVMLATQTLYAQSNKEKAHSNGQEALNQEDKGNFEEAIRLLDEAKKLNPENIYYPYELAYAWYLNKDYKTAQKLLVDVLKEKDPTNRVYELMGNCYDYLGDAAKCISTCEAGLKRYPNSGVLHLEMGNMNRVKKDYDKAMNYYEKGIELDPKFPSNYYWAAKIYCNSTEAVWGMIYGELFINLERGGKRTEEISKLL